jgi:hypothetical protein
MAASLKKRMGDWMQYLNRFVPFQRDWTTLRAFSFAALIGQLICHASAPAPSVHLTWPIIPR